MTGWASSLPRMTVRVGPAPRRVTGFVTRRLSVQVPAGMQTTAPAGASSSTAWSTVPTGTAIAHGMVSRSAGRAHERRRGISDPIAAHRRNLGTYRGPIMGGDCRNRCPPSPLAAERSPAVSSLSLPVRGPRRSSPPCRTPVPERRRVHHRRSCGTRAPCPRYGHRLRAGL